MGHLIVSKLSILCNFSYLHPNRIHTKRTQVFLIRFSIFSKITVEGFNFSTLDDIGSVAAADKGEVKLFTGISSNRHSKAMRQEYFFYLQVLRIPANNSCLSLFV